ncbi:MAG: HTH domain-containing protein [Vicinamibacterales bacterium]
MAASRNRTLIRALGIVRRLDGAKVGATLAELAADSGVCTRTIRRDLEAIESAGIPLVSDEARRWRVFR